ncbi:agmatine deiminase family protein [Aeromonas dhakensis]|uniref:agmatine deiminase family protein n=1 Tax=Aeromonas dhakensis TaxID=196024 RepID=UPI001BFCC74B|nr:agmatine deiminase family protein [Aeromonas dhakensis]MDM5056714.1 agmatine deiminase family protein [Aeromonas dhakensis]MDM5082924.1 agmatine deiminase family protein [Aeromonas dhakensis]UXB13779.1 agmatine deiminase family protein [Aeromonas dhakensis]HDT5887148.1 agmatine deiminase family protein [Aeromonas dhakensis]HEB4979970.1 agmatine deiminase family protein [Aeromonas dhakensis]
MSSRRNVLKQLAAIGALAGLGNLPGKVNAASNNAGEDTATSGEPFHMPDEAAPQTRVWVAFAASADIWGRDYQEVQATIGRLVQAMVPYTQVNVLCRAAEQALARQLCGEQNTRFVIAELDDIWLRDTGGVFVQNGEGALGLVDFNFNGWGDKQEHEQDADVAELISQQASARYLRSKLTGEGGGIEVDGNGTVILTESCWLNNNRNPGVSKAQLEAELKANLGLRKIIWLPGIKGKDITDAHVDFYARFVRPGVVVVNLDNDPHSHDYEVTRRHLAILKQATDADGNKLELHVLPPPLDGRDNRFSRSRDFAAGYINYLPINGAVIAPEFGDKAADSYCHELLTRLYPGREIVQINIDPVAAGGGGIHCITLHQPA